jgi:hypothetical protein
MRLRYDCGCRGVPHGGRRNARIFERVVAFHCWLIEHAPTITPSMALLDTTIVPLKETVAKAEH